MATTFRPSAAAPKPKKDKSGVLMIGLIVAGIVAVIGLGISGLFFSEKTAHLKARVGHEGMLRAICTMAGVPDPPTNGLLDVETAWAPALAALSNQYANTAALEARIVELDGQLTAMEPVQTQLLQAQQDLTRRSDELKKAKDELAAANTAAQQKAADLQSKLDAALADAAEARAAAEAAAAQVATTPAAEAAPVPDAATTAETAPAAEAAANTAAPNAPAADAGAANEAAEEMPEEMTQEQLAIVAGIEAGSYTFPQKATEILQAVNYDRATQTMVVSLRGGQDLQYSEVPADAYEGLLSAPVTDVFFRMRILGSYPCDTDDRRAVRAATPR